MKTFPTLIAVLLLGSVLTVPLAAQLEIGVEGTTDPSVLGQTVVMDAVAVGQRVTQRLYLTFDPGSERDLTLRNIRLIGPGASEFSTDLQGITRLPALITGELTLDLFLSYLPRTPGPARAALEVTMRIGDSDTDPDFSIYTIDIVGRVPSYSLSYVLPSSQPRQVPVAGLVDLGRKATDALSEAALVITNSGSGTGTLQGVSLSGSPSFSLLSPPSFPLRLEPGRSLTLQLGFRPSGDRTYIAQLSLDLGEVTQDYRIAGTGGDLLRFTLRRFPDDASAPVEQAVQSGRGITFSRQAVSVEIVGRNIRQSTQFVNSIRVTGPFRLTASPTLPIGLQPGQEFTIRLEPTAAAAVNPTGTLVIDDAVFPLSVDTPSLPAVRFTREGRTLRAREEVSIGLRLLQPYPVDISGSLQLTLDSAETQGAMAAQWLAGGRSMEFHIPAGSREAVLAGGLRMASFHAGSTSGILSVSASFTAEPWGIDITPATAPQVQFTVEAADLSEISFSRPGGTVAGGEEVALGLSLAEPFGEDLAGTLRMVFESAEAGSGGGAAGQQVSFRIEAGGTAAVFPAGAAEAVFTMPRSEGEAVVTVRLATEEAGLDVTPDTAPELRFTVEVAELPEVSFSREGGTVAGGEEITLGLGLAEPFGEDLAGTLRMVFESAEAGSGGGGGQQVSFRIEAGGTAAVFAAGAGEAVFTMPRSEGEAVVTARFLTEEVGLDVTPETAPELRFTVEVAELPEVSFSRPAGTVAGGEEIALGLSLAEPFGEDLAGTLRLAYESAEAGSGGGAAGQQVSFRIEAGGTEAMFAAGAGEAVFTMPRSEGEAVLTARFATEETGMDVTPDPAPELRFAVEITDLPTVAFSHQGGTVGAADQVGLTLALDEAYPTDVVGVLTLSFETRTYSADPAVQWATGGRQAPFLILAGTTEPVFSGDAVANAFQTGTVAGSIIVTARFFSVPSGVKNRVASIESLNQAGAVAVEITPETVPELRFSVLEGSPVLRTAGLGATGQGRFTLQVTGFATSRSVDGLTFSFTGTSGANLQTPTLNAEVTESFNTYYGGNQSVSFGSQFLVTVEFRFDEGVFEDLASVSVQASNAAGQSNSVSVTLN